MTPTAPPPALGVRDHARAVVLGLVIGGLWIAHRDEPLWEHALRTLVVLAVVPVLAAPLLAWWRRRAGTEEQGYRLSLRRFVVGKALLVVAGVGLDLLLTLWIPDLADIVVAVALLVAVVVAGTRYHHLLLVPTGSAEPADAHS